MTETWEGWSNYETWCAWNWIQNDSPTWQALENAAKMKSRLLDAAITDAINWARRQVAEQDDGDARCVRGKELRDNLLEVLKDAVS